MNKNKILIADDDPVILKFLGEFLTMEGFGVKTAANGVEALAGCQDFQPDLVLLDVKMPLMDGFEVCARIRENSQVPVIFLTAKKEPTDRVMGFTFGSDDYVTKPFDSAELLMRIKAVLRRSKNNSEDRDLREVFETRGLRIDRTARLVQKNGRPVKLTAREFDLLWLMANHPNRVFTREQLVDQIWRTHYLEENGMVAVLITRLRKKIEDDPIHPQFILTIRGVGYKFQLAK